MAMRQFTREQLFDELQRRGCSHFQNDPNLGSFWKAPDGRYFQVPLPDGPNGTYPDYILDDLIKCHGLPSAPTDIH